MDVMSSISINNTKKSKNTNALGLPPSGINISKVSNTLDQRASISNR